MIRTGATFRSTLFPPFRVAQYLVAPTFLASSSLPAKVKQALPTPTDTKDGVGECSSGRAVQEVHPQPWQAAGSAARSIPANPNSIDNLDDAWASTDNGLVGRRLIVGVL
jgi:hypothetical protein